MGGVHGMIPTQIWISGPSGVGSYNFSPGIAFAIVAIVLLVFAAIDDTAKWALWGAGIILFLQIVAIMHLQQYGGSSS